MNIVVIGKKKKWMDKIGVGFGDKMTYSAFWGLGKVGKNGKK